MQRTLKSDLQDPVFLQGAAVGALALIVLKKLFKKKN